ncbi:glycosyltransferase [Ruegeria sp. 2012CJ41-6]|uniref:Glycosyltransferase n=1 Tax=Ruegeria spongiae TaxID=2942209 RepID=A0ABT0Q1N9_9RHOB|nr:glycosyltransferase [Ruegeria spongiae]MCL6283793.1 glycosyltransferase [Ruegeria spongiae]
MPRAAFYAPMKSPNSPVPSGDREMGRNLMRVLERAGYVPDLVSELRIYDKQGDTAHQNRLRAEAQDEATRLIRDLSDDTAIWVTYHSYYKSPDLLGPTVSRARGIPYVQIESTRASSRLTGPWAGFAQAAHRASDAADAIFYLTANDLITLERERFGDQKLVHLPPFLPNDTLPPAAALDGPMLTAAMMRAGDKLASYTLIAQTLDLLQGDWQLQIAGDGPARPQVEALMAPFGDKVRFLGQLDPDAMVETYQRAALFFWPGVNEAFGMVYLEAQAAGLPVVAQDRPGTRDILLPTEYPDPDDGPQALAERINQLRDSPAMRRDLGARARAMIARTHLLPSAAATLRDTLDDLVKG